MPYYMRQLYTAWDCMITDIAAEKAAKNIAVRALKYTWLDHAKRHEDFNRYEILGESTRLMRFWTME